MKTYQAGDELEVQTHLEDNKVVITAISKTSNAIYFKWNRTKAINFALDILETAEGKRTWFRILSNEWDVIQQLRKTHR